MNATKHTPTPWQLNHGDVLQVCDTSDIRGCAPIAIMYSAGGRVEAKHNAAFIVRACNAHDELVAALQELDANLENHQDKPYAQYQRKTIRAALAKIN